MQLWTVFREYLRLAGRSRTVLVALGVLLVFVPTLFGVFVEAASWPGSVRATILGLWLLGAAFVIWGGVAQGQHVADLVGPARERRDEQRLLARTRIFETLLERGTNLPGHYQFRVFVYDADKNRLIPSYQPEGTQPTEGWEPGQGATGQAWQTEEYVLVRGEAVSDGTYGLTPEQQVRYKPLEVVAAMPVRNARGKVIAIITGASTRDDGQLASPEGQRKHRELAIIVGRVLVDLLGDEAD